MSTDETSDEQKTSSKEAKKPNKLKKLLSKLWSTKKRRIITIVVAVIVALGVLFAIPYTRYAIAGLVVKKPATVTIKDSVSGKPVSEVDVSLAGQTVRTNAKGEARFAAVSVGEYRLKIDKKYYQSLEQSLTVPILSNVPSATFTLKATGRSVTVKVVNKVSGTALEKAKVSVSETTAVTDKNGEASIVLPISSKAQKAKVEADGYNTSEIELKVTSADNQKYDAALTPAGKMYYLSKRTGKINVVKSNLDGTDQQVVLEGTGRENDYQTALLASRDWKYLALLAKRDSEKPKIYLINTSNDKVSVIDEGSADFQLVGWSDHRFIYLADRTKPHSWDDKKQALKSYNAESGKLTTLDETSGAGNSDYDYAYESMVFVYILSDRILYVKDWNLAYYTSFNSDKKVGVMSVKPDGGTPQRLKEFLARDTYINARPYAPEEIYYQIGSNDGKKTYYEFEDGKIKDAANTDDDQFNSFYPTYLISPSGDKTFWYEPRDGKNTLFIGNKDAGESKEIATLSEFVPYGWFSDEYLLVSKAGSELYVISRTNPKNAPMKVSDYHRPDLSYPGYGRGYGGF